MIRVLCTDVDGTMTDNVLNITGEGELFKSFNARDGWALVNLLPNAGIEVAVVSGRDSQALRKRCEELNIRRLYLGRNDKGEVLNELASAVGCGMAQIAYIGDDLNDLPAITSAGLSGCPADSVEEIKSETTYICSKTGGKGALREFAEWVIASNEQEQSSDDSMPHGSRIKGSEANAGAFEKWALGELRGPHVVSLATCSGATPSVRSMSALFEGSSMFFQTNSRSRKAAEISDNPCVAISFGGFQMRGLCKAVCHSGSKEGTWFSEAFEQAYPKAYDDYSWLDSEMVYRVDLAYIAAWGSPDYPGMFLELDMGSRSLYMTDKRKA